MERSYNCVIIDDENAKITYSELLKRFSSIVEKDKEFELGKAHSIVDKIKDDDIKNLLDSDLYIFNILIELKNYEGLIKKIQTIKNTEKPLLFLIDFEYKNSARNALDIVKYLINDSKLDDSKFILFTNHSDFYIDYNFISSIKTAGFDAIIKKSEDFEPWEFGLLINKILKSHRSFEFEDGAYNAFMNNLSNSEILTKSEINFLNDLALDMDMWDLAEKYFMDKLKDYIKITDVNVKLSELFERGTPTYKRISNLRESMIKKIAVKLGVTNKNRASVISSGKNYLFKETLRYLIDKFENKSNQENL